MSARRSQSCSSQGTRNPLAVVADLMDDWASDNETDDDAETTMQPLTGDDQMWDHDDNNDDSEEDDGDIPLPRRRITGIPNPPVVAHDDDSEEDVDDPSDEDNVEADHDNVGVEQDNVGRAPHRGQRLLHRNKQINSLAESKNPNNYNMMQMPTHANAKVLSSVLEKKTRTQPAKTMEWTNEKRSNRGRLPR